MKKVTIAIPCFNQAEYLPDTIASALNQTVACEIIVVIDGSPDDSEKIAKNYPVRVIRQINKGLASARNTALMNSNSDYFLPLDSDDILLPNAIEKLLQKAVLNPTGDVFAPSVHCFGTNTQDIILMPNTTLEDFQKGNRLAYCALIRSQMLVDVGGYSPRYDALGGYEDLALWLDILTRGGKIITTQEILMNYRIKENSMWKEASKPEKHRKLMEQIIKDFPTVFPTEELQELVKTKFPL